MSTGKLVSTLRIASLSLLLLFSTNTMANYLVEYEPYPCNTCDVCRTGYHHSIHHRYHHPQRSHHAHRRTSYHIEVYYTVAPYPDFYNETPGCGSCISCGNCQPHPQHVRCARQVYDGGHGDGFATYPVRVVDTCARCSADHSRDYDTATADDITEY